MPGALALATQTEEKAGREKYLTFPMENELYGINIRMVREIVSMQPVTPVPDAPSYVIGVLNLRGRILPIVDMRLRFGRPPAPYGARTCIILLDTEQRAFGIVAENVEEVVCFDSQSIQPTPSFGGKTFARFVRGIAETKDGIVLLLQGEALYADAGPADLPA